jgi:hypothetical protein
MTTVQPDHASPLVHRTLQTLRKYPDRTWTLRALSVLSERPIDTIRASDQGAVSAWGWYLASPLQVPALRYGMGGLGGRGRGGCVTDPIFYGACMFVLIVGVLMDYVQYIGRRRD